MSNSKTISPEERYNQIKKVTLVGAAVNVFLAISKVVLGFLGQSQALIADGLHSLADLVSDVVVLFAARHSSRSADKDHPYGHGRIETVVEVALGLFLVAVAIGILIDATSRLLEPQRLLQPTWLAFFAAVLSIIANESLFQYTIAVSKKIRSKLLSANAWHHRTDAISSVIACVGIVGAMFGFEWLDAIAAIGVSLLISKVGWDISWKSLRELIDTALDESKVKEIKDVIMSVDGVTEVHSLRTRSMGANALVDVHILVVNSRMSVSEGHQISERVMTRLIDEIDDVSDVIVHIDPEDDETNAPCGHLPLRNEIIQLMDNAFAENAYYKNVKNMTLHYLDGKIFVELLLPVSLLTNGKSAEEISYSFVMKKDIEYIENISIQFA